MMPLALPKVQAQSARLVNTLVTKVLPLHFSLNPGSEEDVACKLAWTTQSFEAPAAITLYVSLGGLWRIGFSDLDLLALRAEFADWLRADEGNSFSALPNALKEAVFERLLSPLLEDLSQFFGLPVFFTAPPPANAQLFKEEIHLALTWQSQSKITLISLAWQDPSILLLLLPKLEVLPCKPKTFSRKAQTQVRLILAQMALAKEELFNLEVGDILFPPALVPSKLLLEIGAKLFFTAQAEENILTLGAACSQASSMSETTMTQSAEETNALQNLELEVRFELPGLTLPVEECASLASGYTFTLKADVENLPVLITIGGKTVAQGRLVDVGGVVGVQITTPSAPSS